MVEINFSLERRGAVNCAREETSVRAGAWLVVTLAKRVTGHGQPFC